MQHPYVVKRIDKIIFIVLTDCSAYKSSKQDR